MSVTIETPARGDSREFEQLLSPFQLGPLALKNRVVWLPHLTRYADDDGLPTERHVNYYAERARHGVALIITGSETAHPAVQWGGRINAYDERAVAGYTRMTDAVHQHGSFIIGQLTDDGNQQNGVQLLDWHHVRGPSAVADHMVGLIPKPLSQAEIDDILRYFALSAGTHKEGGFDGVEIKAAHDGLHRQFLSPLFNVREDQYGGCRGEPPPLSARDGRRDARAGRQRLRDRGAAVPRRGARRRIRPRGGRRVRAPDRDLGTVDYINSDRGATGSLPMMNPTMAVPQGYSIELGGQARAASGSRRSPSAASRRPRWPSRRCATARRTSSGWRAR